MSLRTKSRFTAAVLILGGLAAGLPCGPARAFDFFGLFGEDDTPPAPSADSLPYAVTIDVAGDDDLEDVLRQASRLYGLRKDAPPDADALVLRAEADLPRLIDALWGAGYYNARLAVEVAGIPLRLQAERSRAAMEAAGVYRGRAAVPVRIVADPGPRFTMRDIRIVEARTGAPLPPSDLPPGGAGLAPGDAAVSADILAAEAKVVDAFRARSRPFAKVVRREPVVFHEAGVMDVTLAVAPGPVAGIGAIGVRGLDTLDPAVVRSFIYSEPGDPYSPQALAGIRKSVSRIEALSSVRIREADALDPNGNLPIFVDVTERKRHVVGFAANYSTVDGPLVRAYWADRNLFGGGETLRLEGSLFYAGKTDFERAWRRDPDWSDLGGRFTATFMKPALWGTRNDLLADAVAARETTKGYTSRLIGASAAIRHRWSDTFSAQAGVEFERGQASDILGQVDYRLVGLPVSVQYDSTDNPLDPTRGIKFTGSVTPYPTALGSTVGMTVGKAQASTYWALDERDRTVLAARVGFGSIVGADLEDIPANRRFFAGGGGSVRGFAYRSLGPKFLGEPIGGRSLLEASVEARFRITDTIGIVPFVDAGTAFRSSFPDGDNRIRVAAGLGLRYYTAIGPIRLDVAVPVDRRERGDKPVAVYVSIGQAF